MIPEESLLILLSWIFKVKCSGNQRVIGFSMDAKSRCVRFDFSRQTSCIHLCSSIPTLNLAGADIGGGDQEWGIIRLKHVC